MTGLDGLVTVDEAAADLGLRPVTIRAQYRRGRLTGRRLGRRLILIDRESVTAYRIDHLGPRGRRKGGTTA
jgi:excisionase family DNA binding protein